MLLSSDTNSPNHDLILIIPPLSTIDILEMDLSDILDKLATGVATFRSEYDMNMVCHQDQSMD